MKDGTVDDGVSGNYLLCQMNEYCTVTDKLNEVSREQLLRLRQQMRITEC
jgi:hypothetical protein